MLTLLLFALSGPPVLPPPAPDPQHETEPAPRSPERERAQALYAEGTTLYDSANYAGAIDKFTEALALVKNTGEQDERSRLVLLWNIASAHEKAYEIDNDTTHLRQALLLYRRYQGFAERTGDKSEQQDAAQRITSLEKAMAELEAPAEKTPKDSAPPVTVQDDGAWKRPHRIGIGLLVPGVAAVVGGVTVLALGSTYEGRARDKVAKLGDLGVPPDDPAWAEGEAFIAQERRKGKTMMALGGSLVGAGAVLAGVGTFFIVKAKRTRSRVLASPSVSTTYLGISISGRF
jgi:tetratricopeptide (TPR) repeat protein